MSARGSRHRSGRALPALLALGLALAGVAALAQGTAQKPPVPYEGFPPLVPHEDVQTLKGGECLTCHGDGAGGAPIAPHPARTHFCLQCHVGQEQAAKPFPPAPGS